MRKFIKAFPDFHLLDKIEPEPDNWIIHVGCATEAARNRFDAAWGLSLSSDGGGHAGYRGPRNIAPAG